MAGRKIRDKEEARRSLTAAASSGLGRAAWAREHGIDGRSLNAWRLNLERPRRSSMSSSSLRLVELVPSRPAAESATYRVVCGPFIVEVGERFDDEVLGRLLAVVAGC